MALVRVLVEHVRGKVPLNDVSPGLLDEAKWTKWWRSAKDEPSTTYDLREPSHNGAAEANPAGAPNQERRPQPGTVDALTLHEQLTARAGLEAVERWTDRFLSASRVKNQLGGRLRLDRGRLTDLLTCAVETHEHVLVTGPAGTGKSALARAGTRILREQGATVIGLSLTERAWQTISDIDGELGGPGLLKAALAGAPTGQRVLLLDGAEQALSDNGKLLSSLLDLLPRGEGGVALWHVVVVAREQAADAVSRYLTEVGGQVETMNVGDLTDTEVREVVDAFPALAPLERFPRPTRLLRNLYTVEQLVQLVAAGADTSRILGEEDVADCVYEQLVRRGDGAHHGRGEPDDRSAVYLAIADAMISGATFATVREGTGEAKAGLVSDGVLVRERAAHAFAHDVQGDYAVALRLCGPQAPDITAVPQPRRVLRGIRLWAQMRLADAVRQSPTVLAAVWEEIKETSRCLTERNGDRWADLPFEALFEMGRAETGMLALRDQLLEDGGRALVQAAGRRVWSPETMALVLEFLFTNCDELGPVASNGALELAAMWWPTTSHTVLAVAPRIPSAVALWYRGDAGHATAAAVTIACVSGHLDEAARDLLGEVAERYPLSVQRVLEEKGLVTRMARHEPELLVAMAHAFYLKQPCPSVRHYGGVRDVGWPVFYHPPWDMRRTVPNPADFGPFSALLGESEEHGLALIGAIADAATTAETGPTHLRRGTVTLTWPRAGSDVVYTGTSMVWEWAWAGSPGPGPVIAALAALRAWALNHAAAGRPLAQVVDQVLGCGTSIGLAAVAVDVLTTHVDQVYDELDPVLGQLTTWLMPPTPGTHIERALPTLVLSASPERQDVYRSLSQDLTAAYEAARHMSSGFEDRSHAWDDTIPKVAAYLDSSNYRTAALPEGEGHLVVNEAVRRIHMRTEVARQPANDRFTLFMNVQRARNRGDHTNVSELLDRYAAVEEAHRYSPPPDDPWKIENIAAVLAVVVLRAAAADSEAVEQRHVQWAAHELARAATHTPLAVEAEADVVVAKIDPEAADRSAALGLPCLLISPELQEQASETGEDIVAAIQRLAASASVEVRSTLADTLKSLWKEATCTGPDDVLHTTSLVALTEMVATSGLGRGDGVDTAREPCWVSEPLDDALRSGAPVLDPRLAAPAVAFLHCAGRVDCPHGRRAQELFEALSDHDRLTWNTQPGAMASHAHAWRRTHDEAIAAEALSGDRSRLDGYVEAFAPYPDSLIGILHALAAQATTSDTAERLLNLWPDLLGRLLTRGCGKELAQALLPLPPRGVHRLPRSAIRTITEEWATTMKGRPELADHLIDVLEAYGAVTTSNTALILDVLESRVEVVATRSRKVVPFLAHVLSDDMLRKRPLAARAHTLLDGLAAAGHQEALGAQRRLEEAPERG